MAQGHPIPGRGSGRVTLRRIAVRAAAIIGVFVVGFLLGELDDSPDANIGLGLAVFAAVALTVAVGALVDGRRSGTRAALLWWLGAVAAAVVVDLVRQVWEWWQLRDDPPLPPGLESVTSVGALMTDVTASLVVAMVFGASAALLGGVVGGSLHRPGGGSASRDVDPDTAAEPTKP
ncbi:MAG: hypothetical protein ACRC35_06055 [Angustibacter sp.]